MGADGADEKLLKDFTDRNATTAMSRPSEYISLMKDTKFSQISHIDLSKHLLLFFTGMLNVCKEHRESMVKDGVPEGVCVCNIYIYICLYI